MKNLKLPVDTRYNGTRYKAGAIVPVLDRDVEALKAAGWTETKPKETTTPKKASK